MVATSLYTCGSSRGRTFAFCNGTKTAPRFEHTLLRRRNPRQPCRTLAATQQSKGETSDNQRDTDTKLADEMYNAAEHTPAPQDDSYSYSDTEMMGQANEPPLDEEAGEQGVQTGRQEQSRLASDL
jgi:hypothetical protein